MLPQQGESTLWVLQDDSMTHSQPDHKQDVVTSTELGCAPSWGRRELTGSQSAQREKQLKQLLKMAFLGAESALGGSCCASGSGAGAG